MGLSCGVVSGFLTRDRTQAPCTGSKEAYPLDHPGSPRPFSILIAMELPQLWTFVQTLIPPTKITILLFENYMPTVLVFKNC